MISEAVVQSIVRSVITRLQEGAAEASAKTSQPIAAPQPAALSSLREEYRTRYLDVPASEEKFSIEFDSSLPIEIGRPLVCLYEKHQPCDSCGRCEVRGF